eukprot:Clim_evm122s134 gene=Clim_evmTU122s134
MAVADGLRCLLVGEGNFSFALALCINLYGGHGGKDPTSPEAVQKVCHYLGVKPEDKDRLQFTFTSFDSESEVLRKYPECNQILPNIKRYGSKGRYVEVLHDVNAWNVEDRIPGTKWDIIGWNHPHLGLEDFRLHRYLMAHFLVASRTALTESMNARIVLSLVDGQAERWNLRGQCARAKLVDERTPEHFATNGFPGYICKRNTTGQSFKNIKTREHMGSNMESRIMWFIRGDPTAEVKADTADILIDGMVAASLVDQHGNEIDRSEYIPDSSYMKTKGKAPDELYKFPCKECGKRFTSDRGVKTHTRQVHELKKYGAEWKPEGPKEHKCSECECCFAKQTDLWQHRVARHTDLPEDVLASVPDTGKKVEAHEEAECCDLCGQEYPKHLGYEHHLEMLKPIIGLVMNCLRCKDRDFRERRALVQHLKFCVLAAQGEVQTNVTAPATAPATATTAATKA